VSFVRRPEDVLLAKQLIRRAGKDVPVIAKWRAGSDRESGRDSRAADGDDGGARRSRVEMNQSVCRWCRKPIIARAREFRPPGDTATQMLESMTENPRADASGSFGRGHAIFDGSDRR